MSASKKLSNSVKALCFLAKSFPEPKQSAEISEALNCNASKLRLLLSYLVKSSIIESTKGSRGGFKLLKTPDQIQLQEIYCAIEEQKAFPLDMDEKSDSIDQYFNRLYTDIQIEIEEKMKTISLNDILENKNVIPLVKGI